MEYPVGSGAVPTAAIQPAPQHTSGCPETPICNFPQPRSSHPYSIDFGHRKHGHQFDDAAFHHGYYDGYPRRGLLWPVIFVLVGIAAVASVVILVFVVPRR